MAGSRSVRTVGAAMVVLVGMGVLWGLRSREPGEPGKGPGSVVARRPSIFAPDPDQVRASSTAGLVGVVKDADGRTIDGAVVVATRARDRNTVTYSPLLPSGTAVTAGGGKFRFTGLPPGEYGLTAMASGWAPAEKSPVDVVSDGKPDRVIELVLGRGGLLLRGRVIDAGGGTIPGATVRAMKYTPPIPSMFHAKANGEGIYELRLGKGSYGISAEADGYAPSRDSVVLGRDETRDLRLMPAARLYGRVVERKTKQPVPGAEVWLVLDRPRGMAPTRDVKTDDDGNFAFNDIPPGTYAVAARKENLVGYSRMVSVAATEARIDIQVPVDPGTTLRGRTVDPAGKGVAATLGLYKYEPPYDRGLAARSDEDGKFEIGGLLPGRYAVGARAEGYAPSHEELQATSTDVSGHTITLRPEGAIEGQVVTLEGQPVVAAQVFAEVVVKKEGGGQMSTGGGAATDGEGRFRLKELPAGAVNLRARHTELGTGSTDPIEIGAGEKKTVKIVLGAGASIAGRVRHDDGTPAPGVRVHADIRSATGRRGGEDVTGPDGGYKVAGLGPGQVQVIARPSGISGYVIQRPTMITLAEGEQKTGVDLEIPRTGLTISGTVVAPDGAPVSGASISLAPERDGRAFRMPSEMQRALLTGADGAFSIEDISKGTYTVLAFHPSYPDGEAKGIEAGASGLRIQLPGGASVAGLVVGADGRPVADYSLLLLPGPKQGESPAGRTRRIAMGAFENPTQRVRDPGGTFVFERLSAGSYDLKVTTHDGRSGSQVVSLQAGERKTDVRVVLAAGTRIVGRVLDLDSGQPMAGVLVSAAAIGARFRGVDAKTDAQGAFSIDNVPTDQPIRVSMAMDGYINDSREVEAGGKENVDVGTIKLMKGDMEEKLSGPRGVVGMGTQNRNGRAVVARVQEGLPAGKAGIKIGDSILSIDGRDARELGPGALSYLLMGKPGSETVVEVGSAEGGVPRKVTISRVDPDSVKR